MRVTEGMAYQDFLRHLWDVQDRVRVAQDQVATGKKITTPSMDPAGASDIVRLGGEKIEGEQYTRNITFAKSKLEATDTVLDGVERMVERAVTLGQLSLNTTSPASSYVTELNGLRDQIMSSANTTYGGRFIFGGSATTTAPYAKDANSVVTYQGNNEDVLVQASRSSQLQTQIPGSQIFSGPVDVFTTMSDLAAAMTTGNQSEIDAQIGKLQQFAEALSVNRSKIGGYINIATNAQTELGAMNLSREKELDEAQAADMAQAISELTMSEDRLKATLAVGARISQFNILDYL